MQMFTSSNVTEIHPFHQTALIQHELIQDSAPKMILAKVKKQEINSLNLIQLLLSALTHLTAKVYKCGVTMLRLNT